MKPQDNLPKLPALNQLELNVLRLLVRAGREFNQAYGLMADIDYESLQLSGKQFAGYVRVLQRKDYIKCLGVLQLNGVKVRVFKLSEAYKRRCGLPA